MPSRPAPESANRRRTCAGLHALDEGFFDGCVRRAFLNELVLVAEPGIDDTASHLLEVGLRCFALRSTGRRLSGARRAANERDEREKRDAHQTGASLSA